MANKTNTPKKVNANTNISKKKSSYKNPLQTWWGKTIIWVLIFCMVGTIILGFILLFL